MKSELEETFYQNEEALKQAFNYEKLGNQLHMLAYGSSYFSVEPSLNIQRKARIFFDKLITQQLKEESIINTLLYIQARKIIEEYITNRLFQSVQDSPA